MNMNYLIDKKSSVSSPNRANHVAWSKYDWRRSSDHSGRWPI